MMKQSLLCLVALVASLSWCTETAPFIQPIDGEFPGQQAARVMRILRRDDSCPSDYNGCSGQGNSNVCCKSGTTCTVDAANNIACCPIGAACTGTLSGSTTAGGGGGNGATTSSFMFPQSTSATTTTSAPPVSITGSTVAGGAYPFVYIPTSFANAATCVSYYSFCQEEYTSCIVSLGGQYGVTVAGAGGGVTVQGNTAVTSASAALSICSSLSTQACYGLREGYCTAFGTASASNGQFVTGSYAPRRRSSLSEIILAAAAGVLGMFI
ncbi:hypothetical protein BGW36DRAFT_168532 [Talaromyces proteolyticus]|uniref:GPI anchored protein n=1 Tax=Talaromyces proteolyticus TaxID=1131652 RepID=A0AAD4KPJ1_9EURO|nr:uncharacterized protein BGW36DRAFT_168532 [Talaromyces proteolyticus]KAH8697478.1 hypothetical protein BGW36DRAFT_168532 [Talaromyces proteolyticus]